VRGTAPILATRQQTFILPSRLQKTPKSRPVLSVCLSAEKAQRRRTTQWCGHGTSCSSSIENPLRIAGSGREADTTDRCEYGATLWRIDVVTRPHHGEHRIASTPHTTVLSVCPALRRKWRCKQTHRRSATGRKTRWCHTKHRPADTAEYSYTRHAVVGSPSICIAFAAPCVGPVV